MMACCLMTTFVLAQSNSKSSSGDSKLIEWNASGRLSWQDFQGVPPEDAANAALTSSGILINFNYNNRSLSYNITCNFDKTKSWGRIRNDHILAHEQGHFDITEIHARKLYKSLKAYRFRQSTVSNDIHEIYQGIVNDLQQMQNDYDRETDHSRNLYQQKIWLDKIQAELRNYEDYAGYAKLNEKGNQNKP
jgi:hypothetical protein